MKDNTPSNDDERIEIVLPAGMLTKNPATAPQMSTQRFEAADLGKEDAKDGSWSKILSFNAMSVTVVASLLLINALPAKHVSTAYSLVTPAMDDLARGLILMGVNLGLTALALIAMYLVGRLLLWWWSA